MAYSAASIGTISEVYTSATGKIAIRLKEGFSAEGISECPGNNGYAGLSASADSVIKSNILSAYASGYQVMLTLSGCNGSWINISAVYSYKE